jgi:uncharacterized protein
MRAASRSQCAAAPRIPPDSSVKLHSTGPSGQNTFTGYGEGYVLVNGVRHAASVIVLTDRVLPWDAQGFEQLAAAHFEALARLGVEVVLLGTGATLRFPDPRLSRALAEAGIGLEVMDTQAACRTYNILAAEERRVAAALLLG